MEGLKREIPPLYRVREGDTVESVCKQFSLPKIVLIAKNKLKGEVAAGDLLRVYFGGYKIHRVLHLETLEGICKKFGMSREEFIKINGIDFVFSGLEVFVK